MVLPCLQRGVCAPTLHLGLAHRQSRSTKSQPSPTSRRDDTFQIRPESHSPVQRHSRRKPSDVWLHFRKLKSSLQRLLSFLLHAPSALSNPLLPLPNLLEAPTASLLSAMQHRYPRSFIPVPQLRPRSARVMPPAPLPGLVRRVPVGMRLLLRRLLHHATHCIIGGGVWTLPR